MYTYYDNGLENTEVWKSAGGTPVNTITYSYNENNQLLTANDANGTCTFTYDEHGRMRTQKDIWGLTLTFSYDAADRLTQVDDSLSGTRTYTYDTADRVTTITFSDGSAQLRGDFTYSNRNEVTDIKRYTDTAGTTLESESVLAYNDGGSVTTITHKNGGGTTLDSFVYQYDSTGKVTQETSNGDPTRNYTYDATDQLTGDGTNTYSYDLNGNRTLAGYSTTTGNRLTTDGTWNYTYDDEGNRNTKTKISNNEYWTYAYDNSNRLTDVKKYASNGGALQQEVKFSYDVFGNRIEKDVDGDGNGSFEP